jgi:hypothetical protein
VVNFDFPIQRGTGGIEDYVFAFVISLSLSLALSLSLSRSRSRPLARALSLALALALSPSPSLSRLVLVRWSSACRGVARSIGTRTLCMWTKMAASGRSISFGAL